MRDSPLTLRDTDPVLVTLLIGIALMFLVLGYYSFRTHLTLTKLNKDLKESGDSGVLTTGCGCCIFAIVYTWIVIDESGHISILTSEYFTYNKWFLMNGSFGVIGGLLISVNFISTTLRSFQAAALAIIGMKATRKWWMVWLKEMTCLMMSIIAVGLIIIFVLSPSSVYYYGVPIGLSVAAVYAILSYNLFMLSQKEDQRDEKDKDSRVRTRCRELFLFTMISAVCGFVASIECFLLGLYDPNTLIGRYLLTGCGLVCNTMVAAYIYDTSRFTNRRIKAQALYDNERHIQAFDSTNVDQPIKRKGKEITNTEGPTDARSQLESGLPINDKYGRAIIMEIENNDANLKTIGSVPNVGRVGSQVVVKARAPKASRPECIPRTGAKLAEVDPIRWSISIKDWIKFVHACIDTDTWRVIAKAKGEYNISMYDLNDHFVKPWTKNTACSIAGLMNRNQEKASVMISHAWGGSVLETLASMRTLITMYLLPETTPIFFCTLCMYQPEDKAEGGLTIAEQLKKSPFAAVIGSKPKYGMFVIHTTTFELYKRLWCVHEVDESKEENVDIFALFDSERYKKDDMVKNAIIETIRGDCSENDKLYLTTKIKKNGGFELLDEKIKKIRTQGVADLIAVHLFRQVFGIDNIEVEQRDVADLMESTRSMA